MDGQKKVYDARMSQEVELDALGDEWKGYVARIAGGNDKQGFPMKQGVPTSGCMCPPSLLSSSKKVAGSAQAAAVPVAGAPATAASVAEPKKKEEPEEESDDEDVGFGFFD